MVGWMIKVHSHSMTIIREAFFLNGFSIVRLRYLGDNMMLLLGGEEDVMEDIMMETMMLV